MNIISNARNKKGYTQENLARLLDITLRHYVNIENYRTTPNVCLGLHLCKLLDLDPYDVWLY